jgi:hypothetical protein
MLIRLSCDGALCFMAKEKELDWGETPFHKMSPDELLKVAIKMYDACVHAKSALALSSHRDPQSLFWTQGTGGIALEMCNQVVDPLEKQYGSENIWRAFYRPGNDLIWKDNGPLKLTTKWAICPECGNMIGTTLGREQENWGKKCVDAKNPFAPKDCKGVLRPVKWLDLQPKKKV